MPDDEVNVALLSYRIAQLEREVAAVHAAIEENAKSVADYGALVQRGRGMLWVIVALGSVVTFGMGVMAFLRGWGVE